MRKKGVSVDTFLSTLKMEVKATQDARRTMISEKIQSEEEYTDAVVQAHQVVGARIPSRAAMRGTTTLRSTSPKPVKARGMNSSMRSKKLIEPTQTMKEEGEHQNQPQKEYHVYFDPEQDLMALMAFRPQRH